MLALDGSRVRASAQHEHRVPIHIRWVFLVPTGLSGTGLTSFTSSFKRKKENKFTCAVEETSSCAVVIAKWVDEDRMRTNRFTHSTCHLYDPL